MTLTRLLRRNPSALGRGRVQTWSPSKGQATPLSPPRGRHASTALRILARVLLWALLGTLVVRGAIPAHPARPRPLPPPVRETPQQAEAFAVAFATEYLTADGDSADRARRLLPYASSELVSNLDVAASGSRWQRVAFATPAGSSPTGSGYTVVVAARVVPPKPGRWVWLAVPVASRNGRLAVDDLPSIVPAPGRLRIPPPDPSEGDFAVADRAKPVLERFFWLYLGGGDPADLAYLTAPGTTLEQPGLFARRITLTDVTALPEGDQIEATTRLLATDPAGLVWPLAYDVRLIDQDGRLEVAALSPAST